MPTRPLHARILSAASHTCLLASMLLSKPAEAQCVDSRPPFNIPQLAPCLTTSAGDLNGDGRPDLVITRSGGYFSVLIANADGSFGPGVDYNGVLSPESVCIADFDGDGRLDLVAGGFDTGSVTLYVGHSDGTLHLGGTFPAGGDPTRMAVADFNRDGRPDLAISNGYGRGLSIVLGAAGGSFQAPLHYTLGFAGFGIAAADFNEDRRPDVAVADVFTGNVSVMLGNGTGGVSANTDYPVGTGPFSITVADFNQDGHTDIAAGNHIESSVSILLGNGNGVFHSAGPNIPVDGGAWDIVSADFNGDGVQDIAVTSSLGAVQVLIGSGDATFQAPTRFAAGVGPRALAVGDFNSDGRPDVACANQGSSTGGSSLSVFINVLAATPTILLQPRSGLACIRGSTTTLSVAAAPSATLTYQWQWLPQPGTSDWVDIVDGTNYSLHDAEFSATGARTPSMGRRGLPTSRARTFTARCILTNSCGILASDPATLLINSADFDNDGESATTSDIEAFFACLSGRCCATCGSPDFNGDGTWARTRILRHFSGF